MFKVFQPVIVRIERLSIFVAAGGSTGSRPSASGRSQLQEYQRAFYHSGIIVFSYLSGCCFYNNKRLMSMLC